MEALPATSPLTRSNAKSAQKYHMTPASFFTGAPPEDMGRTRKYKAPSVAGGAQKSLYAVFSARETSLVHPLKVDSEIRVAHTMAVRLKPRMTILLSVPVVSSESGSRLWAISQLPTRRAKVARGPSCAQRPRALLRRIVGRGGGGGRRVGAYGLLPAGQAL